MKTLVKLINIIFLLIISLMYCDIKQINEDKTNYEKYTIVKLQINKNTDCDYIFINQENNEKYFPTNIDEYLDNIKYYNKLIYIKYNYIDIDEVCKETKAITIEDLKIKK